MTPSNSPRVLLVAPFREGYKGAYIERALKSIGCTVRVLDDWNFGSIRYNWPNNLKRRFFRMTPPVGKLGIWRVNQLLRKAVIEFEPSLILVSRGDTILSETLAWVRKRKNPPILVNWLPDPIELCQLDRLSIPLYDIFFVKDTRSFEWLREGGYKNVQILPQCCEPSTHYWIESIQKKYALVMVGHLYPERIPTLNALADFQLQIWCPGKWLLLPVSSPLRNRIVGRRLLGLEQTKVFNEAQIVLNPHHPKDGLNLRTFEAAGCSAFQLVEYRDDLHLFFDVEQELVTFRDTEELRVLAAEFLEDPIRCDLFARNAQQRVYKEHTYEIRVNQLLDAVHEEIILTPETWQTMRRNITRKTPSGG